MIQLALKYMAKYFPILVPATLVVGILIGDPLAVFAGLVPWMFAFVTFIGSLKMDFSALRKTLSRPRPIILILSVLRILMPLWALVVGYVVFPGDSYTRLGLLLFALIPVGVNSMVWTIAYRGNLPLDLSIVLLDTLVSPIVLPFSLLLLKGETISLDVPSMMASLLQMIVIPSILGMLVNQFSKGRLPQKWAPKLDPFSRIGLLVVILINGANVSGHFRHIDLSMLAIMAAVCFLSISGYGMTWFLTRMAKLNREDTFAAVFCGGMRNVSTGIVIAVAYFPAAATVPVIFGILFQQLVCGFFAGHMSRFFEKEQFLKNQLKSRPADAV